MGCFDPPCLICNCPPTSAMVIKENLKDINMERIDEKKEPFDIEKIYKFVEKTLHLTT